MRGDWKYGLLFLLLFSGAFAVQAVAGKLAGRELGKAKAGIRFSSVSNLPTFAFYPEQAGDIALVSKKNAPQQNAHTEKILRKTMQIRKAAEDKVGAFLKQRYCIGNNMISSYSPAEASAYEAQFKPKLEELEKLTAVLHSLVQEGPQTNNPKNLTAYQQKLTTLIKEITAGYTEICEVEETLCGCYSG